MNDESMTTQIVNLLRDEKKCCEEILAKIREQEDAIDREDESRLLDILEEKDKMIETFQGLDQNVDGLAKNLSAADRDRLEKEAGGLVEELETTLKQIIDHENNCDEKLKKEKSAVLEKIKELRKGKTLLQGYQMSIRRKPRISRNI